MIIFRLMQKVSVSKILKTDIILLRLEGNTEIDDFGKGISKSFSVKAGDNTNCYLAKMSK